ncbi:S9 family peptidase [uncultured Phenylobacterium sp.]|uniref:alpha/beta hydrolase family protein n=1 Tax=uncultured Phenylobacterium sp. TaxID=349273 RepID=UPI0025FD9E94|nr:S9 family peptidase [uncultured Phenylobacterium sp.]
MKAVWKIALAMVVALAAGAVQARPFTARDLAMLSRVNDPQLSRDGRFLAYALRSTDWNANRGVSSLWILDRRSPSQPSRPMAISDKPAASPRWGPDARTLYFLSARTGVQQVWRTDSDGAVAIQVTNLPIHINSFRISLDGRTLVFSANVFPDCDTLACTRARLDARRRGGATAAGFDRLPLTVWDDWQAGERAQLFAVRLDAADVAPVEPIRLMKNFESEAPDKPFGDDTDYAVAGDRVFFSALEPGAAWGVAAHYKLYWAPLDGSAPPAALEPGAPGSYGKPTLSPDGTRLAYLTRKAFREDLRAAVMVRDLRTGAVREASAGIDRSAEAIRWSGDGRTLYATMADHGRTRLFAIDVANGRVSAMTREGQVTGFAAAADRLVMVRDDLKGPGQLYEVGRGGAVQLTGHNGRTMRDFDLPDAEQFSFKGWNDETVYGWVLPPQGHKRGGKYPVAFLIHGGPHGSFGDAWSYRWNPHVWTGMGFAVVMIDFHGSNGYGEAFSRSIVGHWGDRPLEDLQKGWAAALARYPYLDGDRACALGGSYGGYMVAWIAGAWNAPWKCLVNHAGIMDTRTFALTTDIPGFSEYETGGLVWERNDDYERFNPITKVGQWRVPMLVAHGGRDFRVPLGQGLAAFTAAQRKGVPSRFLYYPDENHWIQRPQNSVAWYGNVEAWMRRWLEAPADSTAAN